MSIRKINPKRLSEDDINARIQQKKQVILRESKTVRQPDPLFLSHFGRRKDGSIRKPMNDAELRDKGIYIDRIMENGTQG
jgi:hypothetical protein